MPRIDFPAIEDTNEFVPLPEGPYTCTLDRIEEGTTRHGDVLWKLRFHVDKGEYAGRYIFDNLVFSQKALPRVKLLCSRMGIDVSQERNLTRDELLDRHVVVAVYVEEFQTDDGQTKQCNRVPWDGFTTAYAGGVENDDDLPF